MSKLFKLLCLPMLLLSVPAAAHEGGHGEGICASDHGGLAGQVAQAGVLSTYKQANWAPTSSVINMAAILKPKRSPITLLYLDGKIVPSHQPNNASAPSIDQPVSKAP